MGREQFHLWQEMIVGLLGAGVTLYGANMIVQQIKADDDRELRQQRHVTLKVARRLRAELETYQQAAAERYTLLREWGRIAVLFHSKTEKEELIASEVKSRLNECKVDPSRILSMKDDIGELGSNCITQYSRFISRLREGVQTGVPSLEDQQDQWLYLSHNGPHCEVMIIFASIVIESNGDTTAADARDLLLTYNEASDNWVNRIKDEEGYLLFTKSKA